MAKTCEVCKKRLLECLCCKSTASLAQINDLYAEHNKRLEDAFENFRAYAEYKADEQREASTKPITLPKTSMEAAKFLSLSHADYIALSFWDSQSIVNREGGLMWPKVEDSFHG